MWESCNVASSLVDSSGQNLSFFVSVTLSVSGDTYRHDSKLSLMSSVQWIDGSRIACVESH